MFGARHRRSYLSCQGCVVAGATFTTPVREGLDGETLRVVVGETEKPLPGALDSRPERISSELRLIIQKTLEPAMHSLLKPSLAFAGAAFLLLGWVLVWCVIKMLKSNRSDTLVTAPLVPDQEIQLPSTGMARLILETPRISADYRDMRIELTEKQTGHTVAASYSVLAAQGTVYGITTMQVPFGPATLLQAGAYRARVSGLKVGSDYSRYRLAISRPYLGRLTLQMIVMVLCAVGMLLDMIWAAWLAGWMKAGPSGMAPGAFS